MPEVIDVDAILSDDPPSDDSEIVFTGFRRDAFKSKLHIEQLDTDGVTYIGFKESTNPPTCTNSRSAPSAVQTPAAGVPPVNARSETNKRAPSASKDGPPVKRHKPTHQPSTTNPHLKRPHAELQASSHIDVDVISISDSEFECKSESESEFDWSSEDERPAKRVALSSARRGCDLDDDPDIIALAQQMSEVMAFEASAAEKAVQFRSLDSLISQQSQSSVIDWPDGLQTPGKLGQWSVCRKNIRTSIPRTRQSKWQRDFSRWSGLRPSGSIWRAPGDINTIAQTRSMIVIASAVADGAADDNAGPYNRDGVLVVWPKLEGCWVDDRAQTLQAHSEEVLAEPDHPARHHFTVNDVAIDPSCPSCFASAGRDRRVLLWSCASVPEGEPPEMVEEIECEDNPEVIKYRPGTSTLAIQCDNGSVYLHADGSTSKFEIVRAIRDHFTAEMAWGLHTSSNYLFASSASLTDGTGCHKVFDVEHHKVVVEFDANKEACSTLALDPSGERLYIATEGPETTYNLRQFDVRARLRKPVQRVALEPFVDTSDKGTIDINSLALSADGLYLAASRTDNWIDVYDPRMLARGPLHSFAHEDSDKPDRRRMYGVVKAEWVDGAPYGVGLVSGGADGCVRLWDVRRSSDDPLNGTVLVKCDNDVSTFALGDMYEGEAPLIVGVCSGQVTVLEHTSTLSTVD